ncbi:MAG TPA: hypothetical protein VFQ61_26280 [Polyangiaceae bacterium]|nr:hypothetical protein [Polyangiaceae bacterium]
MACEIIATDRAVFALWGKPEKADFDRLLDTLQSVTLRTGTPPIYVTRVPGDDPAPSAEERAYLDRLMPKFVELCSTYHVILEGAGFMAALKRGVLVSLFQIRWRRGTFFVHAHSSEVPACLPLLQQQKAASELLRLARARGLLAGEKTEAGASAA